MDHKLFGRLKSRLQNPQYATRHNTGIKKLIADGVVYAESLIEDTCAPHPQKVTRYILESNILPNLYYKDWGDRIKAEKLKADTAAAKKAGISLDDYRIRSLFG